MEFDYYTDNYVHSTKPKNLSVINCLNYLKDKLLFTSDSKNNIQDALTRTLKKTIDSSTIQAGVKKRVKKIFDNISNTFQRKEINEFFTELDKEFETVSNCGLHDIALYIYIYILKNINLSSLETKPTKSFDKNSTELLKKSGDLNTLKLLSYYKKMSDEFNEKVKINDFILFTSSVIFFNLTNFLLYHLGRISF